MPKRSREENNRLLSLLANLDHLSPQEQDELRSLCQVVEEDNEPQVANDENNPLNTTVANESAPVTANSAFALLNAMANNETNMTEDTLREGSTTTNAADGTVGHQLGTVRALTPDPNIAALRTLLEEQRQEMVRMQQAFANMARAQTPVTLPSSNNAVNTTATLSIFGQPAPGSTGAVFINTNDYNQAVESLRQEILQLLQLQDSSFGLAPTFFSRFNVVRLQSDGLDSRSLTDISFAAVANTLINRGSVPRNNPNLSAAVETIIFYILAEGARGPDARPQTAERTITHAAELRDAVMGVRSTQLRRNIALITNQRLGQNHPTNPTPTPAVIRCQICNQVGHTASRCSYFSGSGRGGHAGGRGGGHGGRGGGYQGGRGGGTQGATNQHNSTSNSNGSNGTQAPTKPG